ncbi:hypothetical protein PV328_008408 [Microctonus aethiopoides]|uniref:DDE-1 domain-containing protein n=1 Tax=Microctonus aethiopoides TaxID=144406 RepID=A0AA39FJG3_9HYME|nr:hypothetical protein PV328_008408 [Microctonus aethiopoides]
MNWLSPEWQRLIHISPISETVALNMMVRKLILFRPDNILEVSKPEKFTSDYFKIWLKNVFFPNVKSKSLLWIDSWTGHCPDSVKPVKPSDKEVEVMIIPKGSTRNIQPLDLFGLRVWENFLKHFSDSIIIYGDNSNLHL